MKYSKSLSLAAMACALVIPIAHPVQAETKLRLGHWIPASHPMSIWMQKWADGITKKSGGKLSVPVFPGGQLGGPRQQYDNVRRGVVDISVIALGYTSDRFPIATMIDMPFLGFKSSAQGTAVLNDAGLRQKYFDKEARGLKPLIFFTNQPHQMFSAKKAIRTPADMQGQRLRASGVTPRVFLKMAGASPVGLPSSQLSDSLEKGLIDGMVMDYGAVGLAFKLGPLIKYGSEVNVYLSPFAIIMNPKSYAALKGDHKKLFDQSLVGQDKGIAKVWDGSDSAGKAAVLKAGVQIITLSDAERAKFKALSAKVIDTAIEQRENKGVPARKAFDDILAVVKRVTSQK